jgi:predicted deacylase
VIAVVAVGAALGIGPVAPLPASAAAAPTAALRTGFEARNGASWTTLAEEHAFLSRLDAQSDRVRLAVVGRSAGGRPMTLVIVGPARADVRIRFGSSALFVCTQHGTEPAGREACLQRIRDLALSRSTQTVLFVPTANPDGVATNRRENAAGVDINRTYETLATPEARAITGVLASYRPDVLNDLHEYVAPGGRLVLTRNDASFGPEIAPVIRSFALHLCHRYQEPAIRAGGYGVGPYPGPVVGITLTRAALRRRIVSALTETPRAGTLSPLQRVDAQRRSIDGTLRMLSARAADLARVTAS